MTGLRHPARSRRIHPDRPSRRQPHADRHGDGGALELDDVRFEGLAQALGHDAGLLQAGHGQQHRELLAAVARDHRIAAQVQS